MRRRYSSGAAVAPSLWPAPGISHSGSVRSQGSHLSRSLAHDDRLSEADTRSYLIDPVLRLLGYSGVDDLRREVAIPATKEFVDYELLLDGEPQTLVEAKALRQRITDQHAAQCVQYASVLGVRWCFITNGVEWLLYDAHAKGPLTEKRVAAVRLDGDDESLTRAWEMLSLFGREALEGPNPIASLLIGRVVADELSDPDSSAIGALRRAVRARFGERVTSASIVAAVEKLTHVFPTISQPQEEKDDDAILFEPTVIVPHPASRFAAVGGTTGEGSPWGADGRSWHMEKRCSPRTRDQVLLIDNLLQEHFAVDGPRWNQKDYVGYRVSNNLWLTIWTGPQRLVLDFNVAAGSFESDRIAQDLGLVKFEREDSLSDKLSLPSSVLVRNRNDSADRVRLRIKDDFVLTSEAFLRFVEAAYEAAR